MARIGDRQRTSVFSDGLLAVTDKLCETFATIDIENMLEPMQVFNVAAACSVVLVEPTAAAAQRWVRLAETPETKPGVVHEVRPLTGTVDLAGAREDREERSPDEG